MNFHMNYHLWSECLQQKLFPALEAEIGKLTPAEIEFVRIVEFCELHKFMDSYRWIGVGRKPCSRLALAKSFVAKMVWKLPTTEALIDFLKSSPSLRRLCGWSANNDIPDRSTFSRAFAEFAKSKLAQNAHAQLINKHLGQKIIGHISIDSTAIAARESIVHPQAPSDTTPTETPAPKRGRPRKGEEPAAPAPKRLDLQPKRDLQENLADLPEVCNKGCKRNAQGFTQSWKGYKLHVASTDFDVPICTVLTSASLHDSQVAIPLMQQSASLIKNSCYDLMDSAYDAPQIANFSKSLGHVPIIDPHARRNTDPRVLDPHEKNRFRERSSVERFNSNLKDNWGGRCIYFRGATKVACHLAFGILALTAERLISLLC